MLDHLQIEKIFFIDIETVPQYRNYIDLPVNFKALWDQKAEHLKSNGTIKTPEELYPRAGIYAEFGKIICICLGIINKTENNTTFRIKAFSGHDEKKLLADFGEVINRHFRESVNFLCAHNGKEFDFPYIARRMIVNGIKLPEAFDISGKKPWEADHLIDTMLFWRFGDIKNYTSLDLLCTILGIPTPKNDIHGNDVWRVYWEENDLERIVRYCEKDVVAIARLVMYFKNTELFRDEDVVYV